MLCPYLVWFLRYSEILVENRHNFIAFVALVGMIRWHFIAISVVLKYSQVGKT